MRTLIRHAVALLLLTFFCRLAFQAQETDDASGVPKSLLLGSLNPQQAIPSGKIDTRRIIAAIRRE